MIGQSVIAITVHSLCCKMCCLISIFAILPRWTSSGPSAIRRDRAKAYLRTTIYKLVGNTTAFSVRGK